MLWDWKTAAFNYESHNKYEIIIFAYVHKFSVKYTRRFLSISTKQKKTFFPLLFYFYSLIQKHPFICLLRAKLQRIEGESKNKIT